LSSTDKLTLRHSPNIQKNADIKLSLNVNNIKYLPIKNELIKHAAEPLKLFSWFSTRGPPTVKPTMAAIGSLNERHMSDILKISLSNAICVIVKPSKK